MNIKVKNELAKKRRFRVRNKVSGTAERPRLSVCFTNKHVYAQAIDDTVGKTLVSICTTSKDVKADKVLPNVAGATLLGKKFGEKLKGAKIEAVVFDKGSRRYHGAVKSFADAVRETGINF